MYRFVLLVLLAFALLPAPSHAGTAINGTRLMTWCESTNVDELSTCIGYILSVGDILSDQKIYDGRACLPPGTSGDEMRQLTVLFLRANTKLLDTTSGANLVALAMIHAYPCQKT